MPVCRISLALVLLFLLASCGQPLVTTTSRATRPAGPTPTRATNTTLARPSDAATLATQVPGATLAAPSPTEPPAPTARPTPSPASSPTPAVIITPQLSPQTNEQLWRAQEQNREVFNPPRLYVAQSPVTLQWYDPVSGQTLTIGSIFGVFPVQAQFVLRDGDQPAFEVPYRINGDFGLTAISDAVVQRMRAAGYQESVEAFVLQSDAIQPR